MFGFVPIFDDCSKIDLISALYIMDTMRGQYWDRPLSLILLLEDGRILSSFCYYLPKSG